MLRKSEIEKLIIRIQLELEKIGLQISELKVTDERVVRELEKVDKKFLGIKQRPYFVSPKNYKGLANRLGVSDNEYGKLFGIKFVKDRSSKLSIKT